MRVTGAFFSFGGGLLALGARSRRRARSVTELGFGCSAGGGRALVTAGVASHGVAASPFSFSTEDGLGRALAAGAGGFPRPVFSPDLLLFPTLPGANRALSVHG